LCEYSLLLLTCILLIAQIWPICQV